MLGRVRIAQQNLLFRETPMHFPPQHATQRQRREREAGAVCEVDAQMTGAAKCEEVLRTVVPWASMMDHQLPDIDLSAQSTLPVIANQHGFPLAGEVFAV